MSVTRMLGIFGTNTSPPCILAMQSMTKSTACSSVIQNRVIALVGDRQLARRGLLLEQRDDAAAAADHVAVADASRSGSELVASAA